MKHSLMIGFFIFIISSCTEDLNEYDYLGNYHFSVQEYLYSIVQIDTSFTTEYDTVFYEFDGSIAKFRDNRLLIKYSQSQPIGRCIFSEGSSWCQGTLDSYCVSSCPESQLYFVENWITPLLVDNYELKLFEDYSRKNGQGRFLNNDSIFFILEEYEKNYGSKIIISGKKVND